MNTINFLEGVEWNDIELKPILSNRSNVKRNINNQYSLYGIRNGRIGESSYTKWVRDNEAELNVIYENFEDFLDNDEYDGLFNNMNYTNFTIFMYNYCF